MKILLISPCKDSNLRRSKLIMIPQLALHLIAGLTPPEHEVKIVEEEIEGVNLEEECDLVGLTCMTSNAPRAYDLAREFKKRGRTVVMGGVHPTILPDEALRYADSVVVGEAEGVWRRLLEDFKKGNLSRTYREEYPSLEEYIPMRSRGNTKKRLFGVVPVMTTRGCPYHCDFCCVHDIFGRKIRHVPVENVVRDIVDSGSKHFLFLDDNIVGDPVYAKALFRAIEPLRIKWAGQASISFGNNIELMKLAVKSGCDALFFGLESVSISALERMRKSIKDLHKIEETIKKIKDAGIYFHPSMIFGFDDDTKETFPETLHFLDKNRISSVSLNVLTPYPGTRTYKQFKEEGRLITDNWRYYDHVTAVFRPKHMSTFELQAGRLWVAEEFNKLSSVMKRLPFHLDHPLYHLSINLGLKRSLRDELNAFPLIAEELYPIDGEAVCGGKRVSLRSLKFTDFIPGRWNQAARKA
jgi:radical SAM superfamily enzyme YgiQ (UPF0313 family)